MTKYNAVNRSRQIADGIKRQRKIAALEAEAKALAEDLPKRQEGILVSAQWGRKDGVDENGEKIEQIKARLAEIASELKRLRENATTTTSNELDVDDSE